MLEKQGMIKIALSVTKKLHKLCKSSKPNISEYKNCLITLTHLFSFDVKWWLKIVGNSKMGSGHLYLKGEEKQIV